MTVPTDLIDIHIFNTPEFCSLYQAISWIAFKERPLSGYTSILLYPARYEYVNKLFGDPYFSHYKYNKVEWLQKEDKKSFIAGLRALMATLETEKITAWGNYTTDYEEVESLQKEEDYERYFEIMRPLREGFIGGEFTAWENHTNLKEKNNSSKELQSTQKIGFINHSESKQKVQSFMWSVNIPDWYEATLTVPRVEQFINVSVKTSDLLKLFPYPEAHNEEKKVKQERRGRKAGYNWEEFHVELTRVIHDEGIPGIQRELEEKMLLWCTDKWRKEPAIGSIRPRISNVLSAINNEES